MLHLTDSDESGCVHAHLAAHLRQQVHSPPAAMAHQSNLLTQQQHANIPDHALDPEVVQGRRKFSSLLENTVLDYKHYHPSQLEACIETLDLIFGNVINNPDEAKYRRFKAANKKFLNTVASVKHTEDLLLQAGWRPKVVEMEKSWVFEAEPDTLEFQKLVQFHNVLQRARTTIHAKAERKAKEEEVRRGRHNTERERVLLAIEDDRGQRHLLQQATTHVGPVPAQPLPSEGSRSVYPAAAADAAAEDSDEGFNDENGPAGDEDGQEEPGNSLRRRHQHQQPPPS